MLLRLILLSLLVYLSLPCLMAQEEAEGKLFAVVIGQGEYKDTGSFPKLPFALADAKGVYDYLLAPDGGGLRSEQVQYVANAEKFQLYKAIDWLKAVVRKEDQVLFYYAGHGQQGEATPGKLPLAYLIPVEALGERLDLTAVPLEEFKKELWELQAKQVALVLDCCYSGTVVCDEKGGKRAGVKKKKQAATLERDLPDDRFVLTACAANEQAIELNTHKQGAFTFYLLQGLQGNVADRNKDRRVDMDEAFTFLQQRVSEVARLNKHQQTPTLAKGRASQPYYLRNDSRPMEIMLDKPIALKTIDYLETKEEQVWLEGWVRYGTGVREVYVAQDKATLEDKGAFGTKFQIVVPLRLGKNVISVTAVDKSGAEKPLIVTILRLEDVLVKLDLRPMQATCRPGEQVRFEMSGTTESGATTTSFMVAWQVQHGKMLRPGLYQAPINRRDDEITIGKEVNGKTLTAKASVKIVMPQPVAVTPDPQPDQPPVVTPGDTKPVEQQGEAELTIRLADLEPQIEQAKADGDTDTLFTLGQQKKALQKQLVQMRLVKRQQVQGSLQAEIAKYQQVVSEFGDGMKEKAWQNLVKKCPDGWQADKVTAYDVENLLVPADERTNFQIAVQAQGADSKKRSEFWAGEKTEFQIAWKVANALPAASGKLELYNGKRRLHEQTIAAPIATGIQKFTLPLSLPTPGSYTLTAQVSIGTVVRQKELTLQVKRSPSFTLQGPGSIVEKGALVTYRLTVQNDTGASLSDLSLQATLPEQVKYKGQAMGGKTLTWKLPTLKAGETSSPISYELAHQENGSATTTAQLLIAGNLVATKMANVTVNEERRLAEEKRQATEKKLAEERRLAERKRQELAAKFPGFTISEVSSDGRFVCNSSGVIRDSNSNLEWYVGPDQDTPWAVAKAWTDKLTVDGGGWRMPSIEELNGLYQKGKGRRDHPDVNMDPIFKCTGLNVWTGVLINNGKEAKNFSFWGGCWKRGSLNFKGDGHRGFAVRTRRK